jgi:hypothetical protein
LPWHNENLRDATPVTAIATSKLPSGKVVSMRNTSKISGVALAMVLSSAAAIAADAPAGKPLKAGWDRKQIKVFAYACTDGMLAPVLRDYNAAVQAGGPTLHKPFPEKEFRDSAFPMCLCISERVAQTWTLEEMKNGSQRSKPFVDEALNGGRCKPEGMLADIVRKRKENMK